MLEALGRGDEALAAYFRAIAVDPAAAQAQCRAAALQLDRGQYDQALARLTHVLELTPGATEALYYRGRANLALGHVPEAVTDLRAAAAAWPDRSEVYYHLALALEQAQQMAAAREAAHRALLLSPTGLEIRNLSERLRR